MLLSLHYEINKHMFITLVINYDLRCKAIPHKQSGC